MRIKYTSLNSLFVKYRKSVLNKFQTQLVIKNATKICLPSFYFLFLWLWHYKKDRIYHILQDQSLKIGLQIQRLRTQCCFSRRQWWKTYSFVWKMEVV